MEHFTAQRYDAALKALPSRRAAESTAVGDHALICQARAQFALDNSRGALETFRHLQDRYPSSPLLREAVAGECRSLLKAGDFQAALKCLDKPDLEPNADNLMMRAQALERTGDPAGAAALYLRVLAASAAAPQAATAEARLRVLSPGFATAPANYAIQLERAANLIAAGRNLEARTLLNTLASVRAPDAKAAGRRRLLLGDACINLRRLTEALGHLQKVEAAHADLHAHAVYLRGVCTRALKRETEFLSARDEALRLYPGSPHTERLLYSVATYFDVSNRVPEARAAYSNLAGRFPRGQHTHRSLWKLGMYAFVEEQHQEAIRNFWAALLLDPGDPAAPAYWMGRCYEKLGDAAKAGYLYERGDALGNRSYYGQKAREAREALKKPAVSPSLLVPGVDFELVRRALDGVRFRPESIPAPTRETAVFVERAAQLAAAGLHAVAIEETARAIGRYPEERALRYVLSRLYDSRDDHLRAIQTLRRVFPQYSERTFDTLPEPVWELFFPVKHWEIVSRYAARHALEPSLVLGLIRQESAFQTKARSPADARGLMQILPSTGRGLARQAGMAKYTTAQLFTPDTNIALGTRYLASLIKRYDGRLELALAAYNAGDSRVARWLAEFGDRDLAVFVEMVPFAETRGYIKQVLTNRTHYHMRTARAQTAAP